MERLHEIKKEAYAENLSCLSHWEPRKLPRPPQLWAKWSDPFDLKKVVIIYDIVSIPKKVLGLDFKTNKKDGYLNIADQFNGDTSVGPGVSYSHQGNVGLFFVEKMT